MNFFLEISLVPECVPDSTTVPESLFSKVAKVEDLHPKPIYKKRPCAFHLVDPVPSSRSQMFLLISLCLKINSSELATIFAHHQQIKYKVKIFYSFI